jgi:transposase-like protein
MANKPAAHKANLVKRATFLASLRAGNTVSEAAKSAAINRRTAYDWRDQDAEFRAAWDDAIENSVEELEAEVRRRALDPNDKSSHLLLMFLLKKHKPEYRENFKREVKITHEKVQEFEFSTEEMDNALAILRDAEEKKKQTD